MKKILVILTVCVIGVALIIGAIGVFQGGLNDVSFLFWM